MMINETGDVIQERRAGHVEAAELVRNAQLVERAEQEKRA